MDVRFLRGLSTAYAAIASKDSKTFYFTTDDKKLYLGDVCLSNQDVEERVKVIEDHGYVNGGEVDAKISAAIANYYTKDEIDNKIAGLSVGAIEGRVTTLEEKVEAIEAWDSKDITADDITAWNAEKGAKALIDANKETWDKAGTALQAADKTELEGKIDAAKGYTDSEITGLEFDLSEDGKTLKLKNKAGNEVATLDTTDFVVDGMLTSVVADQANNKLTFTWNTVSGIQETVIELNSIADIYTGSTNADEVNVVVSNTNEISATIGANVKTKIDNGNTAYGWGNHASEGYLKAADISGKEDKANLKALAYKDTVDSADLVNDKVITKAKLEDNVQASLALADSALQSHQDISHLATKQEVKAVSDGLDTLQAQHDTFENEVNTSAVFTSGITADLVAQITTNKETITQNAQTCQNNFNTISNQLTWGEF